jgi:hypothetical protein
MTRARERRVALVIPRFRVALSRLGEAGIAPALPELQWLVSRARRAEAIPADWRAWLMSRFGPGTELLQRAPAGPAVQALASGGPVDGCWACAEPVHLITGLDHLRLAPLPVPPLSTAEAVEIAATMNAALQESGYSLRPSNAGPWTLACPADIECDTVEPARAEGRDVRDSLPAGRDGGRVRWLMNELQMLLHDHPVNASRIGRALVPVNSFWLWGFGRAGALAPMRLPTLCTDDAWLRGLWRLHASEACPLAAAGRAIETEQPLLVAAADPVSDPGSELERSESLLAAPLAAAFRRGAIGSATIRLGDASYVLSRTDRLAMWRRRRGWTELLA